MSSKMKNPVSHVELGFVFIGGEGGIRTPGTRY